jgi:hypothetical protein
VLGVLFFSPPMALRLLLALLALAFSDWRPAAEALLAFFVPVLAAPRLPLERAESLPDFLADDADGEDFEGDDFDGDEEDELRDAIACSLLLTGRVEGRPNAAL